MGRLLVIVAILLAGTGTGISAAWATPRLDGATSNHAVLQRDKSISVSGMAEPGEAVTISFAGKTASSKADREGRFRIVLGEFPAGGPYEMLVAAKSGLLTVQDLLIGDVFLCSGQSNMELPVERAQNSDQVLGSSDDELRLVTVPKATALKPESRFREPPVWEAASPATAASFSAACFYMAQELRKTAKVPIGAIHSSWGGSRISAWMDEPGLRAAGMGEDVETLRLYARDTHAATKAASATWERWWRNQSGDKPGSEPWQPGALLPWQQVPKVAYFNQWGLPELLNYVGMLWFQYVVTLTSEQARQQAVLSIGAVDDADRTWINSKAVGGSSNAGALRSYLVPVGVLAAGRNVVTVNDDNVYANGGMTGPVQAMKLSFADGTSVPLGSGWRYAVGGKPKASAPRSPWDSINGAGTLYNAMIAPLGPIALAGVAWYQGESDTSVPGYDRRLMEMMRDWRRQFGATDLPFAIVQLSAYGATASQPVESGWATLRDIQRRVAEADGHAALAITIDLGDPLDIHPGEKQEVGRRLARAMRALMSGEPSGPSGPRIAAARRNADGSVTLQFNDVSGSLQMRSADRAIGFELCGSDMGSCRYASARASGSEVALDTDGKPVTRVRHGWADAPAVNLFDREGLPAGPFEIKVSER